MANQKRRSRRRNRRRGSLGPFLRAMSLVLAAVVIVAALTLFFKVDQIQVGGNVRYTDEEIIAVTEVEQGDNLILLDKFSIKQRLFRELPYVSEVRFSQKLPDTLIVEVTETSAVAAIGGGGAQWLISANGKILEGVTAAAAGDYLQIKGLEAVSPAVSGTLELAEDSQMTGEELLAVLGQLRERGMLSRTGSLDAGDPEKLILRYDERFQVELPYLEDYSFKLDCLKAAVASLEPNEMGRILLTLKNDNEARFIPEN